MFRYKQFTIIDDNCAMKVGTDGTMLGCWSNLAGSRRILDIGCGSGVLCAIAAQKNDTAKIIGVDVEIGAIKDAKVNVSSLPDSWSSRIDIVETRLQDFIPKKKFDLIISNPPFFENSQVSPDDARNYARHTNSLHYSDVFDFASKHLTGDGRINLVLPYENGLEAIHVAEKFGFHASRVCTVHPVPQKPPHRLLLELTNYPVSLEKTELTIESGKKRHDYTEEYQRLGEEFYLYF